MASRVDQAEKILPKTGVTDVDNLAVLVYSCMQRMGAALLRNDDTRAMQPKGRFLPGPDGQTVLDITDRTNMGKAPVEEQQGEELLTASRSNTSSSSTAAHANALTNAVNARKEDDRAGVLDSSDVQVAESSLIRLLHGASKSLFQLDQSQADNIKLRAHVEQLTQRIACLEASLHGATARIAVLENPQHAFESYREAWQRQFELGQQHLAIDEGAKHAVLLDYVEKRRAVQGSALNVSRRRVLFRETSRLLEEEFKADEASVDRMVSMFRPQAKVASRPPSGYIRGNNAGAVAAVVPGTLASNGADVATAGGLASPSGKGDANATSQSILSAADMSVTFDESTVDKSEVSGFLDANVKGVDVSSARSYRLDALFDADKQPLTAESVRQAVLAKLKKQRQQQLANSADLLVSRNVLTGARRVLPTQSTQSLMNHIFNAFVYAPATYLELELDMATTSGRTEAILEHADKLNLLAVWNSMATMDKPMVRVVKLAGPASDAELLVPYVRSLDVTTVAVAVTHDAFGILPESEQAVERARLHKILGFRRADPEEGEAAAGGGMDGTAVASSHASRNYMLPILEDRDVHFLRLKQVPGMVDYISRAFGSRSVWSSPIAMHALRVYASSMLDACTADALIAPFQDHRGPFFMTRDEPRQFVSVSFSSVLFIPTGYSIGSTHPIVGGLYPRYWRVEASMDGAKWKVLRRHDNDCTLDRHSPTAYWDLMQAKGGSPFYQHFRLVQEGLNAQGTHNFCVCSLEIYGRMMYVSPKGPKISLNVKETRIKKRRFQPFAPLPAQNKAVASSQPKKK